MKKLIIIAVFIISGALANNSYSKDALPIKVCGNAGSFIVCCDMSYGDCLWYSSGGELWHLSNPTYYY